MKRFWVCLTVLAMIFVFSGSGREPLFTQVPDTGLPQSGKTFGCTWADLNGDGRLDMFLSRHGHGAEIYLSRGDLSFELLQTDLGLPPGPHDNHGASAIDFDCDGDWDVYVSAGADRGRDIATNELMVQEVPGIFLSGLGPNHLLADEHTSGRGGLWVELDQDRYPELLLTHYTSRPRLFHNDGGNWFDWSDRVCLERPHDKGRNCQIARAAGADLDLDGDTDLFIAASEWGLLQNRGAGVLVDVTPTTGLPLRHPSLAEALFVDLDYDGDQDLFVAYGAPAHLQLWRNLSRESDIKFELVEDCPNLPVGERIDSALIADLDNDGWLDIYLTQYSTEGNIPNLVAQGLSDGGFKPQTEPWGLAGTAEALPAGAWALDLDRDGDLDLVQVRGRGDFPASTGTVAVFRNNTSGRGFTLRLESATGPPHGLGAQVEWATAGHSLVRQVNSVSSYYNSTVLPLHFGVGQQQGPFTLAVRWPTGRTQEIEIPAAGAAYVLREGETEARILE